MCANDLPLLDTARFTRLLHSIAFVAHEGVTFVNSSAAFSTPDAGASRSAVIVDICPGMAIPNKGYNRRRFRCQSRQCR